MQDKHLSKITNWRYCNIKPGEKIPYENGWQKHPLALPDIHTSNIGLVLGILSGGVCAIDFDGIEAIDHWTNTFGIDIASLDTIMWTSGKEYRCQAAFTVDSEYWDVLKRKVVNKLEFRWTSCQSVLPPSKLNDGREYMWINSPSTHVVQRLPDVVLAYWLELVYNDIREVDVINIQPHTHTMYDEIFIDELLNRISTKVGNLRGDYDVWRTIAWAVCSQLGTHGAKHLMMKYWPEKTKKELKTLNAWKQSHRGPSIGTLIKMSGISALERRMLELQHKLRGK
jgi:hypothetical protein